MSIFEIQSYIDEIENDPSIHEDKNFNKRLEIIDFFEFHVTDYIEDLLRKTAKTDDLILLKHRAEKTKSELEDINTKLFQKLRTNIGTGEYTGRKFKNLISEYVHFSLDNREVHRNIGYDNLDVFINGLTTFQPMPEQTKKLEPEMVFYQKTPAGIVFELVEKIHLNKEDVFFDLGSGLGQVAILVNLLTGITSRGVELEPAFCDYARDCAAELNLSNAAFINTDARKADYSDGTVFFMYTPFTGKMLQEVLDILRKEAQHRKIKIITYGPCTAQVALQSWLDFAAPKDDSVYKLGVFSSL
jgi:SAM-dependent methyltransferase